MAELSEKINQCNLNLKTAHSDVAVKESEKKELQENLKKVSIYVDTELIVINRFVVQANDEADKVPKLQEQIKELSTKVTQLEDKEKSLDEKVKKYKSDHEEKNKEVDKLHEKLKVCTQAYIHIATYVHVLKFYDVSICYFVQAVNTRLGHFPLLT